MRNFKEIKEYGNEQFDDGDMYGHYTICHKSSDETRTIVTVYFRTRPQYNNKFTMITTNSPSLVEMQKEAYRKFEIHTK